MRADAMTFAHGKSIKAIFMFLLVLKKCQMTCMVEGNFV